MALLDEVRAVCGRLAPHGWADLLAAHGLDITAADLGAELARPLTAIDRDVPGFEDFAAEGRRGVQPGIPARSLLFHALASPNVTVRARRAGAGGVPDTGGAGRGGELRVRGASAVPARPARPGGRGAAGRRRLRASSTGPRPRPRTSGTPTSSSPGRASPGWAPPQPRYDGRRRGFLPGVDDDPHGIRVLPARYAAYVAMRRAGDEASFVPLRFRRAGQQEPGDANRQFWLPLHKLFPGRECIRGLDLTVALTATHVNEKIRRIHLALGPDASWNRPDTDRAPFRFTDGIADLAGDPDLDPGTVVPEPHPRLVEPAVYQGAPLTFRVPPNRPLSSSLEHRRRGSVAARPRVRARALPGRRRRDRGRPQRRPRRGRGRRGGGVPRAPLRGLHRRRLGRGGGAGAGHPAASHAERLLARDGARLLPEHRPARADGVDRPARAEPVPPDDLADSRRTRCPTSGSPRTSR